MTAPRLETMMESAPGNPRAAPRSAAPPLAFGATATTPSPGPEAPQRAPSAATEPQNEVPSEPPAARFAVVACSACRQPWAVELRNATASCPACGTAAELARRTRLWQGDNALDAQAAVGEQKIQLTTRDANAAEATLATIRALQQHRPPRHDSTVEMAAAAGKGIANKSLRAEAVVTAFASRQPDVREADLHQAMVMSGLDPERAKLEIVRMLARDLLMEPRPGIYRALPR